MLTFEPVIQRDVGTIVALLTESYIELLLTGQPFWQSERRNWARFDAEVFDNLATIGRCVFLTRRDGDLVGFSSFDPRGGPSSAVIGHNCILPGFRGQGFGKDQIIETLRRLEVRSIRKAVVSTGVHPFFLPAQRMYLACGFQETRRYPGHPELGSQIVEYEMLLS